MGVVSLELFFSVAGTKQKGAHSKGTALCGMHSFVPCTEEGTHMVIEMFGLASKVWLWIERAPTWPQRILFNERRTIFHI